MAFAYKTHETKYTEFNAKSNDQRRICFVHLSISTGHDELNSSGFGRNYIKKELILLIKCLI